MILENFKMYISERPYIAESYSDEDLEKVLNFADKLFDIFFLLDEEFKTSRQYEFALFEEAIYLLQNDPTAEFLTKYEGLSSFSIAGTITATVAQQYLPYISKLVKKYLEGLGYLMIANDSAKISYSYTTF